LRLIRGDALAPTDEAERWINEGGSFATDVTAARS
jgi:hypothetical protein